MQFIAAGGAMRRIPENAAPDDPRTVMHQADGNLRPHGIAHDIGLRDGKFPKDRRTIRRHEAVFVILRMVRFFRFSMTAAVDSDHPIARLGQCVIPAGIAPRDPAAGADPSRNGS